MNLLILISGGCRSGKSGFARKLAEKIPGEKLFLATCPCLDEEMDERIRRHKRDRKNKGWQSVEEQLIIADVISATPPETTILLDCLTLWISNLLLAAEEGGKDLSEDIIADFATELAAVSCQHSGTVIMVTNEVGSGIVPENILARKYRDLVGRCNQIIAAAADHVYFVSCGIPLQLKGKQRENE